MTKDKEAEKKQATKWLALLNIPFQMALIIFVFSRLGMWLDEKYSNGASTFIIILSLVSVFIALYNVIRQVKNLNQDKR